MNLFRKLPRTVQVNGRDIPVDPDFRIFVDLEAEARAGAVEADRLLDRFFCGKVPQDTEAAADAFLWFHRCGDDAELQEKRARAGDRAAYDYAQDMDAIYQSFRLAYGIDLFTEDIHWWRFQKLLFGLPKDCPFMQLIYWRTADVSKLPKGERAFVLRQRRKFAVGRTAEQTMEQRDESLIRRLRRRAEEAGCTK